jgi:23S rRNA (cytosine1962-C5)-methyltransferase
VDLSAKALARGRANFEANGLNPSAHRFFKEDAMKYLGRAARRSERYDFIVLDPPSFATVGQGTFSVKSEYGRAVAACLELLAPGGRLLCVTNHQKTSPGALVRTIRAAADELGIQLSTVKQLSPGLDVPDGPTGPFPSKSVLVEAE